MTALAIELPDTVLSEIAERVTALIHARDEASRSPWMTRAEAAAYLRLPLSRLEKDRSIPSHRDGGRVLYNRDEVDAYFLALDGCGNA